MLSIIRSVLHLEKNSSVTLFYGNLDEKSTIFYQVLKDLAGGSNGKLKVHYIFDKPAAKVEPLFTGMLTQEKVTALFNTYCGAGLNHEYFVCGPGPMMDNVKAVIEATKVPASQFHIEYFTAAVPTTKPVVPEGEVITAKVTVSMYGIETAFVLRSDGKSVLDAALAAGVDVPFACKGAVCCTCRGKIIEGKVRMDQNFALTDNEVAEGFILTCQSHPLTPILKVDYDS